MRRVGSRSAERQGNTGVGFGGITSPGATDVREMMKEQWGEHHQGRQIMSRCLGRWRTSPLLQATLDGGPRPSGTCVGWVHAQRSGKGAQEVGFGGHNVPRGDGCQGDDRGTVANVARGDGCHGAIPRTVANVATSDDARIRLPAGPAAPAVLFACPGETPSLRPGEGPCYIPAAAPQRPGVRRDV